MDLNQLIDASLREGSLDSSGTFTIGIQQAIEKRALHTLEHPDWWVLKVIQAAVAAGSPSISVDFGSSDISFRFEPREKWSASQLAQELAEVQAAPSRSLEHLKLALWACCQQGRPFHIQLAGPSESLAWCDHQLHFAPARSSRTVLKVSHRQKPDGFRLFSHPESDALNYSYDLALRNQAFVCPVPLNLPPTGRNSWIPFVDRLELGAAIPFGVFAHSAAELPGMLVPPHSFEPNGPPQRFRVSKSWQVGTPYAAVTLLRHGDLDDEILWVEDGVVVDSQPLFDRLRGNVSLAVFAPVGGLPQDAGGMRLLESPERQARVKALQQILRRDLASYAWKDGWSDRTMLRWGTWFGVWTAMAFGLSFSLDMVSGYFISGFPMAVVALFTQSANDDSRRKGEISFEIADGVRLLSTFLGQEFLPERATTADG